MKAATTGRVHCGGVVRETAAAVIGVYKDTDPNIQARRREALPRKKGVAVLRPRRDRMARVCVFAAHIERCLSFSRRCMRIPVPYGILPSPVFEAPARFVMK